jgi:hypothetical protein
VFKPTTLVAIQDTPGGIGVIPANELGKFKDEDEPIAYAEPRPQPFSVRMHPDLEPGLYRPRTPEVLGLTDPAAHPRFKDRPQDPLVLGAWRDDEEWWCDPSGQRHLR